MARYFLPHNNHNTHPGGIVQLAPTSNIVTVVAEKILPYDRAVVPQEYGWSCGPAATQVVLNSLGIYTTENSLIQQIGTHTGGTDDISWIETRALDSRVPRAGYTIDYIRNDPPTQAQKDTLWSRVVASINAGFGVVMNWVAPPNNYPRGVYGSVSPTYNGGTIYHYVACMGWRDGPDGRAYWIADSGFRPFGYWVAADQAATLISPKGYTYATAVPAVIVPPVAPTPPKSKSDEYARAIISEGRTARVGEGRYDHPVITEKGIAIALATALVESSLTMYANASDPESLKFPHDAVGSDHDSSGLFQQRPPWWGTIADRMDPARSASMFYHALSGLEYNSDRQSPGWYAQKVQQSAYPDRYDQHYGKAQELLSRLGPTVAGPVSPEPEKPVITDPNLFPSRSPYRDNNDRFMTGLDAILNLDAMSHAGLVVEPAALRGEFWAIEKVARLASGQGPGAYLWWDSSKTDVWAISKAQYILKTIEQINPTALQSYLATKGQQQ